MSSLWKMPSKARLNFVSRSWIRKRGRRPRSSRSISRLRACWAIHVAFGLLVQARYSTLRVAIEMKNSTYNRRSQAVATGEEIAGEHRLSVLPEERAPAELVAPRSWRDAGAGEHVSHQRRRDGDPELAQLADDPNIAPIAVLACEPQD